MKMLPYIIEEVTRQGYKVNEPNGLRRVAWMIDGWQYALKYYSHQLLPDYSDLLVIARMIEPVQNRDGLRRHMVRVRGSNDLPPRPSSLIRRLNRLFVFQSVITPVEFYTELMMIHPFGDGNGRTGKVILNWMNGTLLNPIFPPADLFGEKIKNP